ncbi:hypothetical protein ACLMPK_01260 [Yersinia enterocolitica]|uniref:hypothetical protein n=1 Tax=Yersinia enterocolitica TaxID=630 RepID=UPI00398CF047
MTVSTEINHEEFVGNGITTVFPYRFRILKASNMVVVTIDTDGNETNMVLNTDFTVSGAGSYNGGNVTLSTPLPLGWVVTLTRQLALVQETDLRNQGTFFAEMHENAFDYLTMLIQQSVLWSDLSLRRQTFLSQFFNAEGRRVSNAGNPILPQDLATKIYTDTLAQSVDAHTLRVPEASIPILPIASQRANKVLTFDGAGNATVTVPASGTAVDVLIQLAKPTGANLVGTPSGTVSGDLSSIEDTLNTLGDAAQRNVGTGAANIPDITIADERYKPYSYVPPLSRIWLSAEYTPVINTPTIVNHGLTIADPLACKADVLLKCVVANNGYAVGETAIGLGLWVQSTTVLPPTPLLTTSQIQINTGSQGAGGLLVNPRSNGGNAIAITSSQWRYIFRVIY